MPLTEKQLEHNRRYQRKVQADPVLRARKNAAKRARYARLREDTEAHERHLAARRARRAERRDEINRKQREAYAANPDKVLASVRDYRTRNPNAAYEATKRWSEKHPEQHRELQRRAQQRRRARRRDAFVEAIDELVILERADGMCGICGGDVDPFDFHVDHIVPLARGGQHSYENVQPAHPSCNWRKQHRLPEEVL